MIFIKQLFHSTLARNFLTYSIGALFLKGVSFFLLPLYTRVLTPAEYGSLDLLSSFSGILDIVLSLGLAQVMFVEFYHKDAEERRRLLNQLLSVYLTISTVLYLTVFVVMCFCGQYLFPEIKLLLVGIVMLTTYLTFFQTLLVLILKLSTQAIHVTVIQVAFGVLAVVLNVVFVYNLRTGISGIIWAGFIAMLLSTFYGFFLFKQRVKNFIFSFNKKSFVEFLRLGLPFIPNALALWMMNSANRWILLNYTQLEQVGFYSVAFKFSSLFDPLLIQPFLSSYAPKMLRQFSKGDFRQPIVKYSIGFILFFVVMGFGLKFLAAAMIDENYYPSLKMIPVMTTGLGFSLIAQVSATILVYKKKVGKMLLCILIGSGVSILANFILTPRFGAIGSAYGTLSGNFVWMIALIFLARKERQSLETEKDNIN